MPKKTSVMGYTVRPFLVILFVVMGLLASCTSSLYYASRFVVEETEIHVLVLPPGSLIKNFSPVHPNELDEDSLYTIDEEKIRFIRDVNDSLHIAAFMTALKHHLERLYVTVYDAQDMDEFFRLERPAYIFSIAQMELLEYLHEEVFVARDAGTTFVRREPVTVLENSTWFEFMKLHDADFGMQVLYSAHVTSDYVEGRFVRQADGRVYFDPERYPLTAEDLSDLASFSGKQNAQNMFNHLMNLYVQERMGYEPQNYYHYDIDEHAIINREQPAFIVIKSTANEPEDEPHSDTDH